MPNLVKNLHGSCKDLIKDKVLLGFLVIALVIGLNQIVFSFFLGENRQDAGAFSSTYADAYLFKNLPDGTLTANTNDNVVAEFLVSGGIYGNDNVICGDKLDDLGLAYDNPCYYMIDANGADGPLVVTPTAGIDDDEAKSMIDLYPVGGSLYDVIFGAGSNLCVDSTTPPVSVLFYDSDGDCNTATGTVTAILGNPSGLYTAVPDSLSNAEAPLWIHSDLVNANGAYDFCGGPNSPACPDNSSGTGRLETSGVCGIADAVWQVDLEPLWDDLNADNAYNPGETIYWDPAGCLAPGGACDGTTGPTTCTGLPGPLAIFNYLDDASVSCGSAIAGDGVWQSPEPVWDDLILGMPNGVYDVGETVYWDPSGCLSNGQTGKLLIEPSEYTETVWVSMHIEDNILKNTGSFGGASVGQFQGDSLASFTALGVSGGHGFKDDSTANGLYDGDGSSDVVVIDYDADSVYTIAVDGEVDCDGSITTTSGSCITPAEATPFVAFNGTNFTASDGTNAICANNLTAPTCIYIDSDGDCDNTSGTQLSILGIAGTCGSVADNDIANNWSFYDEYIDGNGGNTGIYDNNIGDLTADDIYYNNSGSGGDAGATYSDRVDENIYSIAPFNHGDPLIDLSTASGPNGGALAWLDADVSGTLNSEDPIFEDLGNIETGVSVANGVIDRSEEAHNFVNFINSGNARANTDITAFKFYHAYTDFKCGTADDILIKSFTWNPVTASWDWPDLGDQPNYTTYLGCLMVDISPTAINGRTVQVALPALLDQNSNGLYDIGDMGWFFYSTNDGPTGGIVSTPNTFTITGGVHPYGGGGGNSKPLDTIAPGIPRNVELAADSTGTVVITWDDPIDSDLSSIVIQRDHNPIIGTVIDEIYKIIDKGVQMVEDIGLKIGETYLYRLKAIDDNGNESDQTDTYSITIPEEGEVIIEPEDPEDVLPSPVEPEVVLPSGVEVGDLIRGVSSPAVYLISSFGQRRPFPTEIVYNSWFEDFSTVRVISDQVLSQIPMGSNMIVRPGTWLMKITTDPKVYAVEEGAIIHWVSTEEVAQALYGIKWNTRIIDMPDTYFADYETGPSISEATYSTGSLISYQSSADIYYIENGTKRLVSETAFSQNHFQTRFVIDNVSSTVFDYETVDPFPVDYDYTMTMTMKNKQRIPVNVSIKDLGYWPGLFDF